MDFKVSYSKITSVDGCQRRNFRQFAYYARKQVGIGKMRMDDVDSNGTYEACAELDGLPVRLVGHRCQMHLAAELSEAGRKGTFGNAQAGYVEEIAREILN